MHWLNIRLIVLLFICAFASNDLRAQKKAPLRDPPWSDQSRNAINVYSGQSIVLIITHGEVVAGKLKSWDKQQIRITSALNNSEANLKFDNTSIKAFIGPHSRLESKYDNDGRWFVFDPAAKKFLQHEDRPVYLRRNFVVTDPDKDGTHTCVITSDGLRKNGTLWFLTPDGIGFQESDQTKALLYPANHIRAVAVVKTKFGKIIGFTNLYLSKKGLIQKQKRRFVEIQNSASAWVKLVTVSLKDGREFNCLTNSLGGHLTGNLQNKKLDKLEALFVFDDKVSEELPYVIECSTINFVNVDGTKYSYDSAGGFFFIPGKNVESCFAFSGCAILLFLAVGAAVLYGYVVKGNWIRGGA